MLTDEARRYAMGLFDLSVEFDSEWSAERRAQNTELRRSTSTWGRVVGDGEIATEYLYAAAHEN